MADETLKIDANHKPVIGLVTDDASQNIRMGRIDDTTKGLKVMVVGGGGTGTVTSIATGAGLTGGTITTSGTIALDSKLAPLDALGTALQSIRVNAGATALEYYTPSSGGITFTSVTGTTQAAAVNNGYIANNAGLVTITLPSTATVGSVVAIVGNGAGGWLLAQNSGQVVNFGITPTTSGAGGSLASVNRYDCVEVVCTVANTTWTVRNSVGNITVT